MKRNETVRNTITIAENVAFPTLRKGKGFKLLLFFAQEIQKKLEPGSVHEIPLSFIRTLLKIRDLSHKAIAVMMEELEQLKLEWKAYDPEWTGFSSVVSSCRYNEKRDVLRYSFDPDFVREYSKHTTPFKNLPISLIMGFKSNYALKIYELAYQYFDPKRKEGKTPQYTKGELRAKFGISENQYKTGGLFLRDVIRKPLKEANELGEYVISFHSNNRRGSLLRYWFSIEINRQTKFNFASIDKPLATTDEEKRKIQAEEELISQKRAKIFLEYWNEDIKGIRLNSMTADERKTWFDPIFKDSPPSLNFFSEIWIIKNYLKVSDEKVKDYERIKSSEGLDTE